MTRIFIRLTATVLSVFILQYCTAQQIDSMMSIYDEQFPHEKIHIHFDKAAYNQEETIWYKVYLLSGSDLSGISKNIYVEWYDTTGKIIKQTVAPVYQASAKGAFELPTGYSGNFIHVKAFTRWMLNDDPAFSYERDIPVNTGAVPPVAKTPVPFQTRVELFPEGGFIVRGIPSRVAFKASNQFGNPVLVKALLLNDKNKVLDTLKVQHDGMGMFTLASKEGENYKVNWTDASGKTGTTPVEITKTKGASMRVTTTNEKALIRVERTADAGDNFKQLNLLVHMNQTLFFKAVMKRADTVSIPIDALPTGILQFSLFTADWIPVAERIIFVNNHLHQINAKISPPLVCLEKRGRNVIDKLFLILQWQICPSLLPTAACRCPKQRSSLISSSAMNCAARFTIPHIT
jgi:hypothetical protein